jgi:hypothetical protein
MINIASSQPVHLPVARAQVVAPVAAVAAVAPTQRTQGDGQSSLGSDRNSRSDSAPDKRQTQDMDPGSLPAAPLLPREPVGGSRNAPTTKDRESVKEQARDAEAAQQEAATKSLKLMEVLSSVWKASAAVVEGVLGIENGKVQGADGGQPADAQRNTDQNLAQHNASDASGQPGDNPLLGRAAGDPVAYTEQGASTWLPLETGQLVREKV